MKKLFTKHVLILSSLFLSFQLKAQEQGTHEIYGGVGVITTNGILNLGADILVTGLSAGHINYQNEKSTPALGFGYKIAAADRWMVGVNGYFESSQSDVYFDNTKDGVVRHSYFTIGLGTDYHYISKKWFQLYSGLEIGYSFGSINYRGSNEDIQNNKDNYINFQLDAVGFRVGKTLALFAEIGFGYKGIAHGGLSLQL